MGVIYLQDYDPWESLGELAGGYGAQRLGLLQQNKMAKGYQSMLNGGDAQQQSVPQQGQFNSTNYVNNELRNNPNSFAGQLMQQNSGGLWGQNPTQAQPAQPAQANTSAPVNPATPATAPQVEQPQTMPQQGLWNFTNINNTGMGVPQTYEQFMQQRSGGVNGNNFFQSAPRLVESGNTKEDKAPGQYSIPDKASVVSQARKQLGANTLALVKSGFDFKTAQQLANEQYQSDINTLYAQQVNDYQEKVLEPMRQQIMNNLVFTQDKDGNPVVDTYNTKRVKGLAPAVARYNYLAGKIGAGAIDMNNLNSIAALDKPNYNFSSAQNGHIIRYNMGDGTIQDMGGYGKVETKQFANGQVIVMTPDGQMKNIGNFGAKNIKVMPDGKTYIVGTDGSMKYVGTHIKPPTAAQTGTSGYNAQVLRTLSAQHTAWIKSHPDEDESSSPYYAQLQSALGGGGASRGSTVKREPSYSSEEQAAVSQRMNELKSQGYTDSQIAAELDAAGFGKYKSWLKSY